MFSQESSRVLSERYVAVRVLGGDDLTPAANEFMTEYAVAGYPTLYVMNAAGHVVVNRVGRTLGDMLDALELGAQREVEFDALAASADPASRIEYATMLCDRMQMEQAEEAFHSILRDAPSADAHAGLAKLHGMRGDRANERKLLTRMLELYPAAPARTSWSIRLITMSLDGVRSRDAWREKLGVVVERLEALQQATEPALPPAPAPANSSATDGAPAAVPTTEADQDPVPDLLARAEVRTTLARYLSMSGRHKDALVHLEWVLEHAATTEFAPAALLGLANVRWREGDYAACKAAFERILAEFPESDAARIAPRGIRNCDARLGK